MRSRLALCALLVSSLPAACAPEPASPDRAAASPVTIFAASSLKELVTEIAGRWSRKTGRATRLQFDASSTLARQIKEGAPADVFITASPEWLEQLDLVERFDWLSNRLVCVVRRDAAQFDLAAAESLAVANEQVPAGTYALAALAHLGVTPPRRTIRGSSARDVLSKVSQGGARVGIVYATDAAIDPAVRVAYTFPVESHPTIVYSVGVLTARGHGFAAALREQASLEAARRRGFVELR